MSLINSTAIPSGATGYEIEQSLRFEDDDASLFNRTPSSAGNRKTWTWSGWVKRGNVQCIKLYFHHSQVIKSVCLSYFLHADKISFVYTMDILSECNKLQLIEIASSWYHVVFVFDTTQSTASNRYKLYINGSSYIIRSSNIHL